MTDSVGPDAAIIQGMQRLQQENVQEAASEQESSQEAFTNWQSEAANPFAASLKNVEKKAKPAKERVQKTDKTEEKPAQLMPIEQIKSMADQFQRRNPELKSQSLVLLRGQIKAGMSKEEILNALKSIYPDVTLADEALDFLLATADPDMKALLQEIKKEFAEQNKIDITKGRNIATQAREAAERGLGTVTDMRDLYRNITGNPRDSTTLFQELSQKYAFKDLKKVVDFLLHSLGADLKSKGPSIPRGQLHRLITETRSLQAILGVYRFFRTRMGLIEKQFTKEQLALPQQLNFESLSKQFMALAGERYPSGDKVLQTAVRLGIEKWIMAKIIVLSQLRDAVREVAVNQIYRSLQHRDDLYLAILEALEDLEDELEELLAREEEEEERKREQEEEEDELE